MAVKSIVKVSELEGAKRLDAEYYQPKYLQAVSLLRGYPLLHKFVYKVIHPSEIKRAYEDKGFPFLLSQNVLENHLDFTQEVFIPTDVAAQIPKNKVEPGDVLMIRTGGIGKAAPYLGEPKNLYSSAHVLILKTKDISGSFLSTYFNTRYGKLVLQRGHYGALQPEIAPSYVRTVPIPRFDKHEESEIENKVREAHWSLQESKSLYLQAEQIVMDELAWDKLDLSQPKSYAISLSQAKNGSRIDAEHFQPKYEKLLNHVKKAGETRQIREFLDEPVSKGVTPDYIPDGEIVVVNSQHLGRYCLNFEATDRTTLAFWERNKRAQIKEHDVMIYATGAYVGRANPYLESARALAGVDLLLVRPNRECNPLYLSVYLNALPGIYQAEKFASGSGQRHIYPGDVKQFLVHLPSQELQKKVADLVLQSYQARKKAKALLEEAKRKVEEAIEEATGR